MPVISSAFAAPTGCVAGCSSFRKSNVEAIAIKLEVTQDTKGLEKSLIKKSVKDKTINEKSSKENLVTDKSKRDKSIKEKVIKGKPSKQCSCFSSIGLCFEKT